MKVFAKTKELEAEVDRFLDTVAEGALVFGRGVDSYLSGDEKDFEHHLQKLFDLESQADSLRRDVESRLYTHSLIPDFRGDVLALIDGMDQLIDQAEKTLSQFDVEKPKIPDELGGRYAALVEVNTAAVDAAVRSARAFFRDAEAVKDDLHRVFFYEKEADRAGDRLKREIFASDMDLAAKMHLRYFVHHIEGISDLAEEVADRIGIYAIKRSV